jgi:hypothetical protein
MATPITVLAGGVVLAAGGRDVAGRAEAVEERVRAAAELVVVRGHLGDRERDLFGPTRPGQGVGRESGALPVVDRHPAAEIRQRVRLDAISAVQVADQVEQHRVLGDLEELAVTQHPAGGREVEADHPDLADVVI